MARPTQNMSRSKSQPRKQTTDATGMHARRAAHYLLGQVIEEGRMLTECLSGGALDHLHPSDRARAQRLALETLRALGRADRVLKPFLQKKPPVFVKNALRLGTVEICQGEAAHGVVNACVEIMARSKNHVKYKGLVNAVLRKVDANKEGWDKLPVPNLPKWLRAPLVEAWGDRYVQRMEHAHFAGAPVDLSVKPDFDVERLDATTLPTGSVRLNKQEKLTGLAGYENGKWWVQDAAAALPVALLAPQKGEKILDLCAAPGGKTMQLAAAGADVTALDLSAGRLKRVQENLDRTKLEATLIQSDAFEFTQSGFDAVLLDAPCSATGTIRRHPDLPYAKDGSEFLYLINQQSEMIDHALTLLRPGGRLVFCTCSLLPDEGEVQAEEALARHKSLSANLNARDLPGIDAEWHSPEGGLRLRPDFWTEQGGMDGFYMISMTKAA